MVCRHLLSHPLVDALLLAGQAKYDSGWQRGGDFFSFFVSRLFLESTEPPVKCVLRLSWRKRVNHRVSYPTSSLYCGYKYVDSRIHISCGPSWMVGDTFTFFKCFNGQVAQATRHFAMEWV